MVTQGMTKNQCDRYKRETNIIIKLRFCKTGPSLLHEEPYQTAIPDKINADFETSNPTPENSKKESYDNSSKNLANFFNGEIIDLDE